MITVKKITAIVLATLMFSLSACGNSSDKASESSGESSISSESSANTDSGLEPSSDKESESSSAEITPTGAVRKYPDAKKGKIKVTAGYKLTVKLTIKGKDDKDTDTATIKVYKIGGKWCMLSPSGF